MKSIKRKTNNRGFSLVELIVIIAIMALAGGAISLSVSLVVGSEAKKAVQKIEASLNEVKTGTMSRYSETLSVQYLLKDEAEGRDTDGFYVVESINTIKKGTGTDAIEVRSMGKEQRRICDKRVAMTLAYKDTSGAETTTDLSSDGSNSFVFEYDRATGLFKPIGIGDASGSITHYGQPVSLTCTSGLRTYTIKFIPETGKHIREN